jgi:N-acetyl sugar amidotransferase
MTNIIECNRCVLTNKADPDITFDSDGICNHCRRYDDLIETRVVSPADRGHAMAELVKKIKKAGRGREYDCLVGVSGGVDSTYVAYLAKSLGLRPLAVHFDNGWDSELAVENIRKTLTALDIDLVTCVVDWQEFRDLQLSFLKASVPDGEIPTDHGIDALVWREAARHGIKYILSGMNFATESISIPSWAYGHSDWKYIRGIHTKFGSIPLRTYPHFGFLYLFYVNFVRRVRIVSILNYVDYHKDAAKELLRKELGWIDYGGKHFESIYTRFFQGVMLPEKFGIDKRYGHQSDLINAGQVSKAEAKAILAMPTYDVNLQREDRVYVIKKLGLTEAQFDEIMQLPRRTFQDFPNSYSFVQFLRNGVNFLRRFGLYPK